MNCISFQPCFFHQIYFMGNEERESNYLVKKKF
ncbi:hypothetical protein LINPERPRIM_LOCUS38286 [Linum perenne]